MGLSLRNRSKLLSHIDTALESVMIFDGITRHAQFPIDIILPGLIRHPGLLFWIPAFAGMTDISIATIP
jgi:hypothetical protein